MDAAGNVTGKLRRRASPPGLFVAGFHGLAGMLHALTTALTHAQFA